MRDVLLQRDFFLLWSAGLISIAGDRMLAVALPLYVYGKTGSVFATSFMVVSIHLPVALLGTAAGVYVDRWHLRRVMVIANCVRAVLLLLLLIIDIDRFLWVVYVVAAIEATVGTFFGPAENALLPRLVKRERLVQANVLNSMNNNLALLIGPFLGALTYTSGGLVGVVVADSATYLIAAGFISSIRSRASSTSQTIAAPSNFHGFKDDLLDGLRRIGLSRLLITLCVVRALGGIGEGLLVPQWIPFLKEILRGTDGYVGVFVSVQAIGGLIGGAVFGTLGGRWNPLAILCAASLIQASIDLIQFNTPLVLTVGPTLHAVAIILVVLFGLLSISKHASYTTLLQVSTTEAFRGRVFGAFDAIGSALFVFGLLLSAPLSSLAGIIPVMNVAGLMFLIGGFTIYLEIRRRRMQN